MNSLKVSASLYHSDSLLDGCQLFECWYLNIFELTTYEADLNTAYVNCELYVEILQTFDFTETLDQNHQLLLWHETGNLAEFSYNDHQMRYWVISHSLGFFICHTQCNLVLLHAVFPFLLIYITSISIISTVNIIVHSCHEFVCWSLQLLFPHKLQRILSPLDLR